MLFDDPATGMPEAQRLRGQLIDVYELQLLKHPPVQCLAHDNPRRQAEARRLAAKDVDRLLKGLAGAGLTITITEKDMA